MKVLLLNGSPHEKGCTYTALNTVKEALEKSGVEAEHMWIGSEPLRGCQACGGCRKAHRCAFEDGLVNEAIARMQEADGLIVGSPVHYAAPGGAILSFLDRMFYAAGTTFAYKPAAAVVSARRGGATAAFEVLNKYFTICQMPIVSSRYWNMVHGNTPDEVRQDIEGLEIMEQLGLNMAWMLKCIEAGRAQGIEPVRQEKRTMTNFIR